MSMPSIWDGAAAACDIAAAAWDVDAVDMGWRRGGM